MTSNTNVELVVYDLSRGMARQLSAQFLGPQYAIDIIPHTAVVVFGREYFFGGGIQHEDPQQFRRYAGMHPIQTLPLGTTSVSRSDFEAWCQQATNNGRYNAAAYDLLERNCNNFSHDAAIEGLRLPKGVPEWILQVPQRFLSSPMGQMIRPMLQNMQVTGGSSSTSAAPFAAAPTNSFAGSTPSVAAVSSPVSSASNPWANLPSTSDTSTSKEVVAKQESEPAVARTKTLDSFRKPLLSKDSQTITLCVKKLVAGLDDTGDQKILQDAATVLKTNDKLKEDDVTKVCTILHEKVLPSGQDGDGDKAKIASVTFALMFLRVVVLHAGPSSKDAVSHCLDWICRQLEAESDQSFLPSTASRTMAWLTLANAAASFQNSVYDFSNNNLVESTLLADWSVSSQARPEVRQAASSFAYNHVLAMGAVSAAEDDDIVSDQATSLVCASLESIDEEPDATTRLRRLLVAGRILCPVDGSTNESIKMLMADLGFVDVLREISVRGDKATGNSNDAAAQCRSLARELAALMSE